MERSAKGRKGSRWRRETGSRGRERGGTVCSVYKYIIIMLVHEGGGRNEGVRVRKGRSLGKKVGERGKKTAESRIERQRRAKKSGEGKAGER